MSRPVGDVEVCLQKEREARDQLMQQWTQFPVGDRSYCRELTTGFDPTYTELLTCLELQRDARMLRERDSNNGTFARIQSKARSPVARCATLTRPRDSVIECPDIETR